METFDRLAAMNSFGTVGRVRLGFAFDGLWMPKQILQDLYSHVRKAGSQLITSHSVYSAAFGGKFRKHNARKTQKLISKTAPNAPSVVQSMHEKGLLGPDILLSHNNNPRPADSALLLEARAKVSSTPSTELQMGQGTPVCFHEDIGHVASLGIDCHSLCGTFMPGEMRLALQSARGRRHEEYEHQGKWTSRLTQTVQDAFNLGTIQGARAMGLSHEIGSIAVGKRADLVIFKSNTPAMIVASDRNPVAAVVLHSSIGDIDTVIIDGIIRKSGGTLQEA